MNSLHVLDRDTAKIIAYNLQKIARQQGKAVIAATTHSDLFEDLKPSVLVHKRFGEEIQINYYPNHPATECSLIKEMKIEEGTNEDWKKLSCFHYRGHGVAVPRKIFRMVRKRRALRCHSLQLPAASLLWKTPSAAKNDNSRNEQTTKYNQPRGYPSKISNHRLRRQANSRNLPLAGTPYVEMIAVMAKYSPFAEKAGMTKIALQQSVESISAVSKALFELGFDLQLLGSDRYIKGKLETLSPEQIRKLKEAFIKNKHPRFKKEFAMSRHQPFGGASDYFVCMMKADSAKLAKLIKLVGVLMQTKVYLFWSNIYLH